MMKTKFFFLAMAVMTAFCTTACSSDDDDNNGGNGGNSGKSAIVTPKHVDDACRITPTEPIDIGKGYKVIDLEMGESGRSHVILTDPQGETRAVNGNYTCSDGVYRIKGKTVDAVVELKPRTRSEEGVNMLISVTLTIDGKTWSYETDIDGGVSAMKVIAASKGGDGDIISSWKVRTKTSDERPAGLLIDLKGDVNLFKTFSGGDLRNIRNEAEKQGAEFTDSERKDFEKTLTYVTFSKSYLTLDYDDGTSDCGTWNWAGSEAKKFNMKMLSKDMGNKFIITNTTGGIEFDKASGFLNVTLNADITGNKNYKATLTIQLEQAPDVK